MNAKTLTQSKKLSKCYFTHDKNFLPFNLRILFMLSSISVDNLNRCTVFIFSIEIIRIFEKLKQSKSPY